jgi:hypothetical protein
VDRDDHCHVPGGRRFADQRHAPAVQSLAGVSLITGAVLPVLVVGVVELGSLVTVSKLHH